MVYGSAQMHSGLPDPMTQPGFYDGVLLKRVFAWIVDVIAITAICLVIGVLGFFVPLFFWPVLFLTVSLLYRIITISGRSATWGMRLVGIEFRNVRGHRFDGGEAALHTVLYLVSMAMFLPQLISWGSMILTARGQGLHDLLMGSAAINSPR